MARKSSTKKPSSKFRERGEEAKLEQTTSTKEVDSNHSDEAKTTNSAPESNPDEIDRLAGMRQTQSKEDSIGALDAASDVEAGGKPGRNGIQRTGTWNRQRRLSTMSTGSIFDQNDWFIYRKIFWMPPTLMVVSLLAGLCCCLALHLTYSGLDGKPVGDQERELRIGTALSYFATVFLIFSVHKAYNQWLWRQVKRGSYRIQSIDAAFSATTDPWALYHLIVHRRLHVPLFIALIYWLIPVTSFVTPATLNVISQNYTAPYQKDVAVLDISNASSFHKYAVYTNDSSTGSDKFAFMQPRTIVDRLAAATVSTGGILPIPKPETNATYKQSFYGPLVPRCQRLNDEERQRFDAYIEKKKASMGPTFRLLGYLAIPSLSNDSYETSELPSSNNIWLYTSEFSTNPCLGFPTDIKGNYLSCGLYNASIEIEASWLNGVQKIRAIRKEAKNPVAYPDALVDSSDRSKSQMAYSAVMNAMSSRIFGSMALFQDDKKNNGQIFSVIQSNISSSILIGTSSLRDFFLLHHRITLNGTDKDWCTAKESSQRVADIKYAGNRTLEDLIPELSLNITLGLLSDSELAAKEPYTVDVTSLRNVYIYRSRNVVICYIPACVFAIFANCLGILAFLLNNGSYDTSFSSIMSATREIHNSTLNYHECEARLPLTGEMRKSPLIFYADENRHGFGVYEPPSEKQETPH